VLDDAHLLLEGRREPVAAVAHRRRRPALPRIELDLLDPVVTETDPPQALQLPLEAGALIGLDVGEGVLEEPEADVGGVLLLDLRELPLRVHGRRDDVRNGESDGAAAGHDGHQDQERDRESHLSDPPSGRNRGRNCAESMGQHIGRGGIRLETRPAAMLSLSKEGPWRRRPTRT
jgi:hypothetical protein